MSDETIRTHETGVGPRALSKMQIVLAELIGKPLQFARISYGDELTLHFGDLMPARSPKLKGYEYGTHIVRVRGSWWFLVIAKKLFVGSRYGSKDSRSNGLSIGNKKSIEETIRAHQGISVKSVYTTFVVKHAPLIGLCITMSDGGVLDINPCYRDADELEKDKRTELSDWDILTPEGLLSVGPGCKWNFEPSGGTALVK
jgi:hypothetical protein